LLSNFLIKLLDSVESFRNALNHINFLAHQYFGETITIDPISTKLAFKLIDGFYKSLEKEAKVIHKEWVSAQFYETPRG
jgi:hypothetical protein